MNKLLNYLKTISSVIGMISFILILIEINTTIFPDKAFTISAVVFLLSALILFLCVIITLIQLLIHKKLQKYLKQHWKKVIVDWAILCIVIFICLTITEGFSYFTLWCIPVSLAIELLLIITHNF